MLSYDNKRLLLNLSRRAIEYYFDSHKTLEPDLGGIPYEICEDSGVFVTIKRNDGSVRGSIGYVDPIKQIWRAVIENSVNSAFFDSKFRPLVRDELDSIYIQITLIDSKEKIFYRNSEELVSKIVPGRGYIVRKGMHSAIHLPTVWNKFRSKEAFLDHICESAGLRHDAWERDQLDITSFTSESFSERDL